MVYGPEGSYCFCFTGTHIKHLGLHVEMQLMCNIEERCVAGKVDPDVPYTDVVVTQEVQPRRFGGKQKLTRIDAC